MTDRPHALYRMYNAAGDLLYIGITVGAAVRWGQHRAERDWWPDVATITLEHYSCRYLAERAERRAIEAEEPRFNRQYSAQWHAAYPKAYKLYPD